jgi:hypothetical protein
MAKTIATANTRECILKIKEALDLRRLLKKSTLRIPRFLCSYCKRPVKAESKGRTTPAHFEHLKRNLECPLSDKTTAKRLYARHRSAKKAALARKRIAAGKKAAATKRRRAAGRKAAETRKRRQEQDGASV